MPTVHPALRIPRSPNSDANDDCATLRNLTQLFQRPDGPSGDTEADLDADGRPAQSDSRQAVASSTSKDQAHQAEMFTRGATLRSLVHPLSDHEAPSAKDGARPSAASPPQAADEEELKARESSLPRHRAFVDDFEARLHGDATSRGRPGDAHITSVDVANALLGALMQRLEEPPELSDQQKAAIELILNGQKQEKIAETLGVHRVTLWRWRRQDPDFRRALAIAREQALAHATEQLRELVPKALEVVQSELQGENLQAALQVLRLVRIDRREPLPAHPTALVRPQSR